MQEVDYETSKILYDLILFMTFFIYVALNITVIYFLFIKDKLKK